jgi:hypothetical protein
MQGTFNPFDLSSMSPEGEKTLDHLSSTQTYTKLSFVHFDKSDHNSILMIPAYKQTTKVGSTSDLLNTEVVR